MASKKAAAASRKKALRLLIGMNIFLALALAAICGVLFFTGMM